MNAIFVEIFNNRCHIFNGKVFQNITLPGVFLKLFVLFNDKIVHPYSDEASWLAYDEHNQWVWKGINQEPIVVGAGYFVGKDFASNVYTLGIRNLFQPKSIWLKDSGTIIEGDFANPTIINDSFTDVTEKVIEVTIVDEELACSLYYAKQAGNQYAMEAFTPSATNFT